MTTSYSILRVNRTFHKVRDDQQRLIEIIDVSFSEIFSPIQAENPQTALTIARVLHPNFRFVIAVQPTKAFRDSLTRPPESRPSGRNPHPARPFRGRRRN